MSGMALRVLNFATFPLISFSGSPFLNSKFPKSLCFQTKTITISKRRTRKCVHTKLKLPVISAALPPLDLTEDNIMLVLEDARSEFPQIFDTSVGMTGKVDLAELDGPFVKISLKGRFWHERSMVLARISNYLKIRIPEILEVDIEDEKQLDDSPANF